MTLNRVFRRNKHTVQTPALHRVSRFGVLAIILAFPSCSDRPGPEKPTPEAASVVGRVLTPDLWAGSTTSGVGPQPGADVRANGGLLTIRGLIETFHPVYDHPIQAYERIVRMQTGRQRQLIAVTQDHAALGRVLEQRSGLPDRRFTGDVIFPLGLWAQEEMREFSATEFTLFGPALRIVILEILEIDYVFEGVAHSLSYRLSIRDEAGRVLDCSISVYSPGLGLVTFKASNYWKSGTECAN